MKILSALAAVAALQVPLGFADAASIKSVEVYGRILVDDKGMTLYTFDEDLVGFSSCVASCAAKWRPAIAPSTASAIDSWSIVKRGGGIAQWAYEHRPLYTYAKDKKAGDVIGDGAENGWHVARPWAAYDRWDIAKAGCWRTIAQTWGHIETVRKAMAKAVQYGRWRCGQDRCGDTTMKAHFNLASVAAEISSCLSRSERQALRLVLAEDKSYREAARILRCSEGEVQTRLLRARNRLRGALW
jgi:predicted lipoprotein with Yx(FWY)xxD motif